MRAMIATATSSPYARVTDTTKLYSFLRLQVEELVEEALQSFRHITDRERLFTGLRSITKPYSCSRAVSDVERH